MEGSWVVKETRAMRRNGKGAWNSGDDRHCFARRSSSSLWITLCVSLSLALIAHSFGSVLFSAVWSLAACEPHLKHYASALRFLLLLRWCHSPFHGLSNCNGVTRTGWPFQKAFLSGSFFLMACQLALVM